ESHVERGRNRVALRPEQPLEPALAEGRVRAVDLGARLLEHARELAQRYAFLVLAAVDRIGVVGYVRLELLGRADEIEAPLVERRRHTGLKLSQLVAVPVDG